MIIRRINIFHCCEAGEECSSTDLATETGREMSVKPITAPGQNHDSKLVS